MAEYPLLEKIASPQDLRQLRTDLLPEVCIQIRSFLIDTLSVNPGHFASSMGAVELAVALHYVFNTPYDRLVWDVGHQAYAHKLLTGRREAFAKGNRKLGGLRAFPNPDESPYDTFSAGHASNSISAALGMAIASELKKESPRRNVVAVIGDAAISGGLAFEGINNAANSRNNLLIVLNDNDMSIDPNVGSLNSYLAHITTSRPYNTLRYNLYQGARRLGLVSDKGRGSILRFNNSLKSLISHQQNIFEGLNIRYFGPIDGNDIDRLVRVLMEIKDMEGPRILHVKTIKGKGYKPAEADPCTWHAPGRFDPISGRRLAMDEPVEGRPPKYQDVFGETLLELAKEDDRIVGITAAMPSGTSIATMQREMPSRVFDVGISEGHAVTFAGGLAREGLKPFVAIYSSFLQRGYDQIINDLSLQRLPVTLCIDRAGLVGEDGPTHHGAFDMAFLRPVPGIILAAPSDEVSLRRILVTAARGSHGVMAIRYPRGRGKTSEWKCRLEPLPIGKGRRLREGKDVAVLSIGPIKDEVTTAINQIVKESGRSIAHYDMQFLKPLDHDLMEEVAALGCPIVTVEDGTVIGGLGTAVSEWLLNNRHIHQRVTKIGIPDQFVTQGTVAQLYELCGMDANGIAKVIKEAL